MKALTFCIELEQPVLATALQGEPNSSVSLPYLPGSLLRGMLIARYQQQHGAITPEDATIRRLFFDGSTRYLNGYLYTGYLYTKESKRRLLPIPRSLRRLKNAAEDDATVYDLSCKQWDAARQREVERNNGNNDTLKVWNGGYGRLDSIGEHANPERHVAIHVQRDRKQGKAQRESGAVFRYDALAAGQVFQAVILCDDAQDAATLTNLLKQKAVAWVGRSRSAGYGRVRLSQPEELNDWNEATAPTELAAATSHTLTLLSDTLLLDASGQPVTTVTDAVSHTLTLLSDTLLLDASGQPVTTVTDAVLSTVLGVSVRVVPRHTFIGVTQHGGFNAAWKLPLPQQYALAAGSVISFTLDTAIPHDTVATLVAQGIGARRAEGFGRIAFNYAGQSVSYSISKAAPSKTQTTGTTTMPAAQQAIAQRLARRRLEQQIDRRLIEWVNTVRIEGSIKASQLNRVRTLVRQHLPAGNAGAVWNALEGFAPTAQNQFNQARIATGGTSQTLLEWIQELLTEPATAYEFIDFDPATVTVVGVTYQLDSNLKNRTALRVLAAAMEKGVRDKLEDKA